MKTIIAIDPGQAGGLAVARFGKVECWPMPETQGDLLALLREIKAADVIETHETECVLEEVGGFAGQAQPGAAMFKFGEHFGFIKGVVQTLGIKLVMVRPQKWQKVFGLGTAARCASKTEWKNKLKAEAQRRFPQLKVTLKTADALLILEYAQAGFTRINTNDHEGDFTAAKEFQPRMGPDGRGFLTEGNEENEDGTKPDRVNAELQTGTVTSDQ